MKPLTDAEKAYFDTIKQVTRSPRPEHLSLRRMTLYERDDRVDFEEVAVIGQTVLDSDSGEVAGWMPLALILSDEMTARLRSVDGQEPESRSAEGLEGPA